ncbi:acyltransferase [Phycicoccus sp. Soil802]|uniref:acyltransferase family protein n=1 Tax=Phycicoccus sp. Soil802 TaxID=1736414 RepID=UPI000702CDA7|nr:acyltransferase [Phycicoccus sp. Soil802]KRF27839.1 hypothetical protein ASG91_10045 [Phycicoccus sp. Soil802]
MTLGESLEGRNNALNALRLLFAVLVIASHSFALTGRHEPSYVGVPLGGWAVAGFFAISGYLISRARLHTDLATFLLRRGRRIYPAFWTCCAVIAFCFSPLAAHLTGSPYDPRTGAGYVVLNATTSMQQVIIGTETFGAPPTLIMWNGSAWTLAFEITCYLIIGAALTVTLVRKHHIIAAVCAYAIGGTTAIVTDSQQGLAWFVALFAAGWIVSTRSRQLTATKATTAIALLFALGAAQIHPVLAALPLSYAVLGAGALLPSRWFTTNDISYGTYLYGWPIQQLLLIAELDELGLFVFIAAAISLSLAAGAVSWFLLERRCLPKRRSIVTSPTLAPQSITQPA